MFNPCCCTSLEKGVKIVAVISLIFSIALIAEEVALIGIRGCAGIADIEAQNPEFGNVENLHYETPELINSESSSTPATAVIVKLNVTTTTMTKKPENVTSPLIDFAAPTTICSLKLSEVIVSGIWMLSWFIDIGIAILLVYGVHVRSPRLCRIWFYIRCALVTFKIVFLIIYFIAGLPMLWKIPVILLCIFRLYSLWIVSCYITELTTEKEAKEKSRQSTASSMQDLERFGKEHNVGMTPLW